MASEEVWKAELEKINGVNQILWEFGTKKGVTIVDMDSEPEDLVAYLKSVMSPKAVEEIEEEGRKEVPPIPEDYMEKMMESMGNN